MLTPDTEHILKTDYMTRFVHIRFLTLRHKIVHHDLGDDWVDGSHFCTIISKVPGAKLEVVTLVLGVQQGHKGISSATKALWRSFDLTLDDKLAFPSLQEVVVMLDFYESVPELKFRNMHKYFPLLDSSGRLVVIRRVTSLLSQPFESLRQIVLATL
jgi:hypothetical protein